VAKLIAILLLLSIGTAHAQSKYITQLDGTRLSTTRVDSIITTLMAKADVTGLNLGIINNNKIAYVKSYGLKNVETAQPIDTATIFYGASFSKAVFGYLVMQLVQEGKINLDKPVYEYLDKPIPDYPNYKDLAGDDRWKLISARHCLSHTTGFPNWRWANPKGNGKLEIFFTPGARYAYSGEGLVLLQLVVEKITGRSLEELMKEKVFQPTGMTRTSYLWQQEFENNYALGYNEDGKVLAKKKRTSTNAAGSMETTIADYSRFISAVMQGKGLSKQSFKEMVSPQVSINSFRQFPSLRTDTTTDNNKIHLSYGLGWGVLTSPYGKAFFKEGHDDGWEHYNINFIDKGTGIIIMTNSSNGESIFKEVLEKIIGDMSTPWQWESYTPYRTAAAIPAEMSAGYAGVYKQKELAVTILAENGSLLLDAPDVGLNKVRVYREEKDRFFTRIANITLEFIRDGSGKIVKIVGDDGSDKFELIKVVH
jgi:CubicO group peptidase (beta-lactamase class C family)